MYILDSEGNKVDGFMRGAIDYVSFRKNLVVKYKNSPYTLVIENPDKRTLEKYTREWRNQLGVNFCIILKN